MLTALFFDATILVTILAVVIIAVTVLLGVGLPLLFILPMIKRLRQNSVLRQTGEPAQAKILKIWDTGVTLNDNPQVGLLLEVYAADRPPFQTETESVVSRLQIPLVQVGSLVNVRFDRQDVSKVALVM